jgi:hypothetical protein
MLRWRRPKARLDDVVEYLAGIGTMLQSIDNWLEQIARRLAEDDDGED